MVRLPILGYLTHATGTATWDGCWQPLIKKSAPRASSQTGGPNDDDDEAALVRKLMPIVAAIIVLAVVFGG